MPRHRHLMSRHGHLMPRHVTHQLKKLESNVSGMNPLCRGMSSMFKIQFPVACRGIMVVILKYKKPIFSFLLPFFPNSLNHNPLKHQILSTPLPQSLFQLTNLQTNTRTHPFPPFLSLEFPHLLAYLFMICSRFHLMGFVLRFK